MNLYKVKKWGSIAEGGEFFKLGVFAMWYPGRPNQISYLTDEFWIYDPAVFKYLWDLNQSAFRKRIFTPDVWAVKHVDWKLPPNRNAYLKAVAKKAWAMTPAGNPIRKLFAATVLYFKTRKEAIAKWKIDRKAFDDQPTWKKLLRLRWRNLIAAENIVNVLEDNGVYAHIQTIDPSAPLSVEVVNHDALPHLVHDVKGINRRLVTVPLPQNPWYLPLFSSVPVWLSMKLLEKI